MVKIMLIMRIIVKILLIIMVIILMMVKRTDNDANYVNDNVNNI